MISTEGTEDYAKDAEICILSLYFGVLRGRHSIGSPARGRRPRQNNRHREIPRPPRREKRNRIHKKQ